MADEQGLIWVHSNRVDDRVAVSEQDAAHPGGWAVVGGASPELVARTPRIVGALREGVIVEIPEPAPGAKHPVALDAPFAGGVAPDQPGQPTHLGRKIDADLLPEGGLAQVERAQAAAPDEVPVPPGVDVAPAETERTSTRRK